MIPLGSYDLSDPKNPWIADRKRSTKSSIVTLFLEIVSSQRPNKNHRDPQKIKLFWRPKPSLTLNLVCNLENRF